MTDSWPAPAKLNLFLHIIGRREDGYHLLQSVFQFLDFSDSLQFSCREDGRIQRINNVPGVAEQDDLCVRAAKLLQQETHVSQGVDIQLDKKLPLGGGVGGGSSDAATTLVALNHIWKTGLELHQLAALGLKLGADVPVFVHGYAAFAEGVGEKLQAINLPEPWFLVVKPPVHVSTEKIFNDPQLTRNSPAIRICDLQTGAMEINDLTNVCGPIAVHHYPAIAEVVEYLKHHGKARMTGTGACVFVAFDTQAQAQTALNDLSEKWRGFVARGMNTSPLHRRLAELS
jgi:4-diphosphocytidyl-2-C-methyl-D-erythritol kinase